MQKSMTDYENIGRFISNISDSWRNSIYITCSVCRCEHEKGCEDLLASFDLEGRPSLILVRDANYIFKTIIDKSECMAEISNVKFSEIFKKYIEHISVDNKELCPFIQLVMSKNREKTPENREKKGK